MISISSKKQFESEKGAAVQVRTSLCFYTVAISHGEEVRIIGPGVDVDIPLETFPEIDNLSDEAIASIAVILFESGVIT